ncbi:MAG: exodeoxyribonuclease III [Crocinitomicaceae bacterium]|nr:exodeoxyribonuclease III [Crocinitomicaceae bacterium]
MKIISFNVNGIRAIAQKNFFSDIETINPDILCLQETKATVEQVKETVRSLFGYEVYANEANKKGYSGTAILTKKTPISVSYGIGEEEHDTEGRVTCLEFEEFFLVNVYVPNSGGELARLGYRQEWDRAFLAYLKKLEVSKHVLVCGDLNVAHKAIDLARPKENYNKAAGFMQEEIDGMDNYHADGLIDTFRFKYPEQVKYTWWSYRGGARERNVGWRIDYFLASERFLEKIEDAFVFNEIHGSDHCPVGVKLHLS